MSSVQGRKYFVNKSLINTPSSFGFINRLIFNSSVVTASLRPLKIKFSFWESPALYHFVIFILTRCLASLLEVKGYVDFFTYLKDDKNARNRDKRNEAEYNLSLLYIGLSRPKTKYEKHLNFKRFSDINAKQCERNHLRVKLFWWYLETELWIN